MENKYCPFCGRKTLRFIETCYSNRDEIKTSWTCDCSNCSNVVVYIYQLIR